MVIARLVMWIGDVSDLVLPGSIFINLHNTIHSFR